MNDNICSKSLFIPMLRSGIVVLSFCLVPAFTSLLINGCTGSNMVVKKAADNVLYEMGEQEALSLVKSAMNRVLPEQNIFPLKKPRLGYLVHETLSPGYQKYARFKETTYIYEVDLQRSTGVMTNDGSVTGYTYTIEGNGDLKAGPQKLARLEQHLKAAFDASGRAVTVSSIGPAKSSPPVVKSKKIPAAAPSTSPPSSTSRSKTPMIKNEDVFSKLKKLKELHNQGIISDKEFQRKKKELLDRI